MGVDVFFNGAGALADSVRIWGLANGETRQPSGYDKARAPAALATTQ